MPRKSDEARAPAIRTAVRDAAFRVELVIGLNRAAQELLEAGGLRCVALFWQRRALIAEGAPAFHLAHGGTLKTLVQDDNHCGPAPALRTTVAFILPAGAGRLVAAAGPGGSVPPCSRSPGSLGSISMNGWKK
jgi:hypothetical protein